jgi:aspartate/methionine/tyrosine aminotransferase
MSNRATTIKTASRLDGIQEYYFAAKLREIARLKAAGQPVLNLGIGSPDLPPAPEVVAALHQTAVLPQSHGYQSYNGVPALRDAFANWYKRWYGVSLDANGEILPLLGSKEGIVHIAMTYLEPGDVALAPDPGYPTYRAATLLAGATVKTYGLHEANGWYPDFDALEAMDHCRTRLMWVNYPHMPSGAPASDAVFQRLIAFGLKHNILIVNDNPYSFILSEQPKSILAVPDAKAIALELNSLSKAQNMAGWRVGMVAGAAEHISQVLRFKSNMDSGMFLAVQMAAVTALQLPADWYHGLNQTYRRRQQQAIQLLESLDCTVAPGQQGMFVWGKVPAAFQHDGFVLSDELLYGADVFLTPGGIFGDNGKAYIRISLCSEETVFEEAQRRVATRVLA